MESNWQMEDNWALRGLSGRQLQENRESTSGTRNARQLGDKWETTSETQLGNKGASNRRHLETIGRPIRGDKWELWKAIERRF